MRGTKLSKRAVRFAVIGALGLGVAGAIGLSTWANAGETPAPAPTVTVVTPTSAVQTPPADQSTQQMDSDAAVWS